MDRRSAYVLLAVIGAGVFLAGMELLITAVALPSILADLADPTGGSAWADLRKASKVTLGVAAGAVAVTAASAAISAVREQQGS